MTDETSPEAPQDPDQAVAASVEDFHQRWSEGEQYQRDVAEAYLKYQDDPQGWGRWCAQMDAWRKATQG